MANWRRILPWLRGLLPILLLGAVAYALTRELRTFHVHDVLGAISTLRGGLIALALGLTAANYLMLTLYDVVALRHVGKPLPYPRVALTSFVAYAFGHNVGFAFLSSASVRYRLYSAWGLSAVDVTQVTAFNGVTFWMGLFATGGVTFLWLPANSGVAAVLTVGVVRLLGVVFLALVAAYLVASARLRTPLTVRGISLSFPRLEVALAQVAVSVVDWVLAALVLDALLPAGLVSLPELVALFITAQLGGLVSQVPGGIGVFESVVLKALSGRMDAPDLLGRLLVYRACYYLIPFLLSVVMLAGTELARRREWVARAMKNAGGAFASVVPPAAALGAFIGGTVLLFSGATPAVGVRLQALERFFPLGLVEASHLLGSVAGISLLLLARGLQQRLDGAYVLSLALLALGGVVSLVKGFDYEEAIFLFTLALTLAPFREQFYRRTSLVAEPFTFGWVLGAVLVIGASLWLGFFSFRHVDYSRELWWRFAFFEGDAPRFLRASVVSVTGALAFGLLHLMRPARVEPGRPTGAELDAAAALVRKCPDSSAHLALLGDKALLFDEQRTAFVMYAVEGRSWVAMGDPVGAPAAATEVAWRFRELADRHGGTACFYQVASDGLPRYLDLGMALLKLGEEAIVPLEGFSLEGPERRTLRHGYRRLLREGFALDVREESAVPAFLPRLGEISRAWMEDKGTREKGFSLGFFDEAYLKRCPLALVRKGEEIIAFANLWTSDVKEELSVDLMRYAPGAARTGVMDFLFSALLLWGQEQGYRRFNLGMAPFSGFEERALAPFWNRLGGFVFRRGQQFYNFQGLRQYKEKFRPHWRPRYLAAPGGLQLPRTLTNIAALVNRGLSGVVSK
ncbi:MAG TPA: bifunctional lysylphosphatidylglycerol flippase/synthetase MprF [Myxococcaceae bacterium]